jgi:FAD:protein FMN transferase
MRLRLCATALCFALLLTGCGAAATEQGSGSDTATSTASSTASSSEVQSASADIFAMDTYMTITCYGDQCEEAVEAAKAEITRLDNLLSVGNADSEISVINANGSGTMSEDTAAMVNEALSLYQTTGGAFDITVYPIMELWGFTTGNFAVPDASTLASVLAASGSDKVTVDGSSITLAEGQGIDLGGIAKGYTSGRLMEIFKEYNLVSGVVSLGGNVQCYGTKPDGSLWRCGIQDPNNPDSDSYLGVISISDKAVITSGAYERYFVDEATGETYHHIIDPKTGYPANNGLTSVSVVSSNGMLADGLSTSCYVMGLEQSIEYWRTYGSDFDLILMDDNGEVYVTEPIADQFTSDFTVHVISQEGVS